MKPPPSVCHFGTCRTCGRSFISTCDGCGWEPGPDWKAARQAEADHANRLARQGVARA
jgi:hypothetical protein